MSEATCAPAVGIDLGTTYSLVACVDNQMRPTTLANEEGDLLTPSVVFLDRHGAVVGKEAVKAAELEPDRAAHHPKRDMGRDQFRRPVRGEHWRPEILQALILQKLKRDAEAKLGPVARCVITVPAYFNEPRRKATQDAGQMAGWEVLDILNEPVAAAIAYGVQRGFLDANQNSQRPETILVYDLGGGTFDATLMRVEANRFTTIATGGDVELGGIDWDQRLAAFLAERFRETHGRDPREDSEGLARLIGAAESAKRTLSTRTEVVVPFSFGGHNARIAFTRAEFEDATADLADRTMLTIRKLLREARMTMADVTRLLAVGGATRMPMIATGLEQETGFKVDRFLSADESVAHGAAIYANCLAEERRTGKRTFTIQNVNSHALGVLGIDRATGMKRRHIMVPRQTPLPAAATQCFATYRENQRRVSVVVVEGGDASGNSATHIGRCHVEDLPPDLPRNAPVHVTFTYSASGRLEVSATMPQFNRQTRMVVERSAGMPEEQLQEWARRIAAGLPDDVSMPDSTDITPVGSSTDDSLPDEPPESKADLTSFDFWSIEQREKSHRAQPELHKSEKEVTITPTDPPDDPFGFTKKQ